MPQQRSTGKKDDAENGTCQAATGTETVTATVNKKKRSSTAANTRRNSRSQGASRSSGGVRNPNMDRYDMEDVVVAPPNENDVSSPLKELRLKLQAGTLTRKDFIEFFKREAPKYFDIRNEVDKGERMLRSIQIYLVFMLPYARNYRYTHTFVTRLSPALELAHVAMVAIERSYTFPLPRFTHHEH